MKRRTLLATGCALAIPGCSLRDDSERPPSVDDPEPSAWSTYRGNVAQSGRAATALEPPYEIERLRQFGTGLSVELPSMPAPTAGLAVTQDTVYATAADEYFAPIAISRTGHDLHWRFDDVIEETREQAFFRTPVPVAIGDDVFVQTHWDLARIDGPDGTLIWSEDGTTTTNGPMIGDRTRLYYPDTVGSVETRSGEYLGSHRFRDRGVFEGVSVGYGNAVAVARTNGGHDGVIAGYDTDDWSVQWQDDTVQPCFEAPAIHDGTAIALTDASREGIHGGGGKTIAYDLATGAVRWRIETPDARVGVALDGEGTAYVPHERSGVLALDTEAGTRKWHASRSLSSLVGDPDDCYPPIVADDAVVISGRGGLAILDRTDGAVRHHLDRPLFGMPAVAYGDVYAITDQAILAIRGSS